MFSGAAEDTIQVSTDDGGCRAVVSVTLTITLTVGVGVEGIMASFSDELGLLRASLEGRP